MSCGVIGVAILGSTGSVGENTLDVIARHPDRFRVVALGAHRNVAQARRAVPCDFRRRYAALADAQRGRASCAGELRARGADHARARRRRRRWWRSPRCPKCDSVMAAIVGAAGLRSTLAAARAGKRLLLANKESLVMAGPAADARGARVGRHAAADRQRAQRDLPVPAARRACAARRRRACAASC